jgi:pentatricopeptide repeat protein
VRYPDFKHKKTQAALWLNSKLKPAWVEAELAAMPPETVESNNFQWNVRLKRYTKTGQYEKAIELFHQMQQKGIVYDSFTFVQVLNACASLQALKEGRHVHLQIAQSCCESNIYVASSLVDMYAKCGCIEDAWKVFNKMPTHNVVSWSAMIKGYARCGQGHKALDLYHQMQLEGVQPDAVTFVGVLNACSSIGALEQGRHIHTQIIKSGCESNVYVGSSLVDMYAKCGSIDDALRLFNRMPTRNVVSWSAMIQGYVKCGQGRKALELYHWMQREQVQPDAGTFVSVLSACTSVGALEEGQLVHEQILQSGSCKSDVTVGNSLIDMYAKCGSMEDARRVFDDMSTQDVVSWTAMIQGHVKCGQGHEALALYQQMRCQEGMEPNPVTFLGVLNACASVMALEEGRSVHEQIIRSGCESDVFVGSSLVDMYAKCGSIKDAQRVFDEMPTRNVVSWTAMILGYVKCGQGHKALELFQQMQMEEGIKPNPVTFVGVLNGCAIMGALEEGRHIHKQIAQCGLESELFVSSSLVDMYAKCGSIEDARRVFNQMPKRNVVSWSTMIQGYVNCGQGQEALKLYQQMLSEGIEPNAITFVGVLNACASAVALDKGRLLHEQIVLSGFESDLCVSNSLVDMYAKCGSVEDAERVFNNMHAWDVVSWNAMLRGYAMHGCGKEAIGHFEWMCKEGIEIDQITFVHLLSACSHAGLVDEGVCYFESMGLVYNISATVAHNACIVDLLGRAGCLDEAEDLIKIMSCEPDATLWKALLSACRLHCDMEMGERVAQKLVNLYQNDDDQNDR